MIGCLSNRSADVRKGRKRGRVEKNSGVQRVGEKCGRCGEIRTGMGCGEGPARKERGMEPDDLLCSRNARLEKALVGRAQWKINQPPSLKR
jgi:hypothetical protein